MTRTSADDGSGRREGRSGPDAPTWSADPVAPARPAAPAAHVDAGDSGGEQACWLAQVCPECGALTERSSPTCWRCGAPRTQEDA